MGPSTNLLPGERSQEIASLLTQVPPLCRKVLTAIHNLSVLRSWVGCDPLTPGGSREMKRQTADPATQKDASPVV